MADISKCSGGGCPLRDSCYRYTAKSNEFWQAYLSTVPYNKDLKTCDSFWNNKEYKVG